jgi:hypothetical protein
MLQCGPPLQPFVQSAAFYQLDRRSALLELREQKQKQKQATRDNNAQQDDLDQCDPRSGSILLAAMRISGGILILILALTFHS